MGDNRGNLVAFAHKAIDEGASIVVGHGPHVLRGMELYKGHLIAYSLGNFLTYGNFNISGLTGITCILDIEINLNDGEFIKGQIIPFVQKKPGIPYYDKKNQSISLIKELSYNIDKNTPLLFSNDGSISIK